ncbi:hypothetical protein [uncultured Ruminococcus sp.]|uniref:hypothetical protein n=1 Tax=uncultured Ruminococcus sp. TaxID=165186 RepID=UPI002930528B|nr:hypothetical protein [uncultured Ruminococcus sp.]
MLQGKKLSKWLSDKRIVKIAVIIGTAAVLLIGLSSFIDFSGSEKDNSDRYAAKTEAHLLEIISQISGVGEAKIFLTMDNGGENVYLKNTDTKTKSIEPKVRGVVVVCDGGDDPLVVARVMAAVTKSLNIGSDKVCITK